MTNPPTALRFDDPRLHPLMLDTWTIQQADPTRHVYPSPHASQRLAELIQGTHDITVFDDPAIVQSDGTRRTPPFYDAAHYVASLAMLLDATYRLGALEHTGDWDWFIGITTRDGQRFGDGYYVYPGTNVTAEDAETEYAKADAHGYADTFAVPGLTDTESPVRTTAILPHDPNWPSDPMYANLEIHIDRWHAVGHTQLNDILLLKDIASITISEG